MRILFLTHYAWPHVGGVEKHVERIADRLQGMGHEVKIISEEDIKYPHIKFLGLFYIWFWLWKNRDLIQKTDIIHIHDVFIWYLPFRFIYPNKKVYITFHGWGGKWPVPFKERWLMKLGAKLSSGTICVGTYIPKYFGIKTDYVIYGGVEKINAKNANAKLKNSVIFLGRLEKETGVYEFLERLKVNGQGLKVEFVGDGSLRRLCEKYGVVHGFCDPTPFLEKASICFAGGYLSALEALEYGCELWTGANTPVKKDYWKMFPYKKGSKLPTWEDIGKIYESLYLHNG